MSYSREALAKKQYKLAAPVSFGWRRLKLPTNLWPSVTSANDWQIRLYQILMRNNHINYPVAVRWCLGAIDMQKDAWHFQWIRHLHILAWRPLGCLRWRRNALSKVIKDFSSGAAFYVQKIAFGTTSDGEISQLLNIAFSCFTFAWY